MASKICIADTRNQVDDFAVRSIESQGYKVKRMTLPFGDFALIDNLTCAVDIKSSGGGIVEIARNICDRFNSIYGDVLKMPEPFLYTGTIVC